MTKWERIFRSWHPGAVVEDKRTRSGTIIYVRKNLGSRTFAGVGTTRELAWADACSALRLDKEKH
jgi:hypothetical protein